MSQNTSESRGINMQLLKAGMINHEPFICLNVNTTGNDKGAPERLTQIAAAAYSYNPDKDRYELQDHIFMLAKANADDLAAKRARLFPTPENATALLKEEFLNDILAGQAKIDKAYEYISKWEIQIGEINNTLENNKSITPSERDKLIKRVRELWDKIGEKRDSVLIYKRFLYDITDKNVENILSSPECETYIQSHLAEKIHALKHTPSLETILEKQGINEAAWITTGEGLTPAELQLGLSNFFQSYNTPDTKLLVGGAYFTQRFLDKECISVPNYRDLCKDAKFNVIDMTRAGKGTPSQGIDYQKFAEFYQTKTGRKIQHFDSLTKALCLSEIACGLTGQAVQHYSQKYLESSVKESAITHSKEFVISSERAVSMNWEPSKTPNFMNAEYIFDSLEFVDFGNYKRYVDLDKMFEINDNFEITLEGEKEPIKSWGELEAKIKSLNACLSETLLDRIKAKYEKMEQLAQSMEKDLSASETLAPTQGNVSHILHLKNNIEDMQEILDDESYEENEEYSEGNSSLSALTAHLQTISNTFTQRLENVETEEKKIPANQQIATYKILKKATAEMPLIVKFVSEMLDKINFNACNEPYFVTVDAYKKYSVNAVTLTNLTVCPAKDRLYELTKNDIAIKIDGEHIVYFDNEYMQFDVSRLDGGTTPSTEKEYCLNVFAEHYPSIKETLIDCVAKKMNEYICKREENVKSAKEKISRLNDYLKD